MTGMLTVWQSTEWWWLPALVSGGFAAGWLGRARARRRASAPAEAAAAAATPAAADDPFDQLDLLDHIGDSAGIGFYHWNVVSGEVLWSRRHRSMFGVDAGSPVSLALFDRCLHPDDIDGVKAAIARAFAERKDYVHEYRIRLDSGELRTIRGSGRISFDGAGRPLRMSGAVIDISAATEARLAVMRRERELAAIIENLPDVITRFDLQQRHLFVSPCIEAITGMPPSAFIGKTNEELGMDALMCARWRAVLDDVIRNGIVRELEFSFFDPQGKEHFFVTRAIPAFDGAGAVESVLTIASDHTAREVAARRLRASEALLQQADLRKNEYLATLAHELRGPLAPIATAVQLMKLSERSEVWQKSRQVIERQVGQLVELVDDLMDVGRISSGKLELRLARVALQPAVEHAIESVRPLFDGAGQQLTVSMPAAPIWLQADATRLTQIFTNLLTNAAKYSPAGAQVTLQASMEGDKVCVLVSDTGIGLTAAAMETIFDMFSQVHAQGEQARGGLGIGLSLVRQLVTLHQGDIGVTSAGPGKGAQFSVRLPLAPAAEAIDSAPRPSPAAAAMPPRQVLVVDDNVDGADTLVALLAALGHHARSVHKGQDAIAAAEAGAYDLVLLDLGLPDISGVQVALHVRGKPWGRDLKLVALTGLGQQHDRDLTRLAGFNLHLVKPVRIDDLLALVGDASTSSSASV